MPICTATATICSFMVISGLIFLHVIALHSSIAGMEFCAWAIVLGLFVARVRQRKFPKYESWWLPYGILVAVSALSLLVNPALRPFWLQFGFMRFGFPLLALTWALRAQWSPQFEKHLVNVWLVALGVAGAYGIFQCLTGVDFIRPGTGHVAAQGGVWRACGFFSLSLTYAYCMGLSLFGISSRAFSVKPKWFALSMLALGALGVIGSLSRGAWLAMLICVLFYLCVERRKWLLPFLVVAAVGVAGLAAFAPGFNDKISGMLHMTMDHSSEMRVHLWRAYSQMFLDHPIFGVGLFQGDRLLPEYYEKLGIVEPFTSHAHNNYLQFLAGTGIFGFAAYLLLIGTFLVRSWRMRRVSPWAWGLFLAQMFLHLGGLTEANFLDGEVNHFLIFTWAMTLAIERKKE